MNDIQLPKWVQADPKGLAAPGFRAGTRFPSAAMAVLLLAVLPGCKRSDSGQDPPMKAPPAPPTARPSTPLFEEVTERVGLDFVSECGPDRTYYMPESINSGAALLDFDNDGDLDIYVISARQAPDATTRPEPAPTNRLYRHEPDHTFVDVTDSSGLGDTGYGMGVAVGDIDNDGYVDLYVTNDGPNVLYRNAGDGTFVDVTERAGVGHPGWGVSTTFFDYDADGYLDLYLVNYVLLDIAVVCVDKTGRREYCGPERFPGAPDVLYHNNKDGTFTDVTAASGIGAASGQPGLGVVCADLTDDGRIDIYVANDNQPNQLWVNQGDGTFRDDAVLMGVAYNAAGATEASMGVVCCDLDGDVDLDLFMTHIRGESNTLYANEGGGEFRDVSARQGIVSGSMRFTTFGVGSIDFDHDGDLDLAMVSGHVFRSPVEQGASLSPFWNDYAQPGTLLENDGHGHFSDVSDGAGAFASTVQVGRGLALGDLDDDGDLDILTSANCGRARVFYNQCPDQGHWLFVRAYDAALKRNAYGAVVTVTAGGRRLVRTANPGYSFMSSSDPRAHFGLGDSPTFETIEVLWPGGVRERFPGGAADRAITLGRGEGTPASE